MDGLKMNHFQIKEKEEAQREYREAVSQGHGAYLMDQDAPVGCGAHPGVSVLTAEDLKQEAHV
jgi:hypothetical protein